MRSYRIFAAALLSGLIAFGGAQAQDYPAQTIKLVVPEMLLFERANEWLCFFFVDVMWGKMILCNQYCDNRESPSVYLRYYQVGDPEEDGGQP